MVATDLDGTLLRRDGTLSPRTLRALDAARGGGAEVVVVTARPPRYLDRLATATGLTGTAVCSNGADVYDLASRAVLSSRVLAPDTVRRVTDALTAAVPGIAFALETGTRVLFEPAFGLRHAGDEAAEMPVPSREALWRSGVAVTKLLAWSDSIDADTLMTLARVVAPEWAQVTHSGGPGLLEISAPGVTKASTLAEVCAGWSVSAAEVVAFGDMPNDLAVLGWAGAGYAMGNAHPAVLAATSLRTSTNEEDGVAAVLERLFGTGTSTGAGTGAGTVLAPAERAGTAADTQTTPA
ncbi:HAD family hydrolase [uncultured Streptomyces sp.]|uniref:HAD family hydrolase n=1 Tax=uncultured Streptomyces sp. TaxID=174707 RepID=UPI00262F4E79|nr:HAD family hydrolase [uncultured Streptomyces sp.]